MVIREHFTRKLNVSENTLAFICMRRCMRANTRAHGAARQTDWLGHWEKKPLRFMVRGKGKWII